MPPPTNTVIRRYTSSDVGQVLAVLEATYGERAPRAAVLDWWCFRCPEALNGFMVAEIEGRVVGVQPMELFRFVDAGWSGTGGLLTGVAVHPEFRRRGIFSALVGGCEQEAWRLGASFVLTMPNERSHPGFLKLGYADLGRRQFLVRPLNAQALGKAAVPVPGVGWLASRLMAVVQAVMKPRRAAGEFRVREVEDLPEDLAVVEQRHATHFPGLRMQRSAAWWRWRYLQSPERVYRLFEARTATGEVVGVAASASEIRDGLRVAYLMDVAVLRTEALEGLVAGVIDAARGDGAAAIGAVTSSAAMTRALCSAGFWAVPRWLPVKRFHTVARFNPDRDGQVRSTWRFIGGWYQMLGDWDNL